MTKLYCPKGHSGIQHIRGTFSLGLPYHLFCFECDRPYFEIDCLTQAQIDSNSVESPQIKDVNDTNVVESKVIPSEMEWVNPKRESQIAIDRIIDAVAATQKEVEKWNGSFEWAYFLQKLEELNKC